MKKTQPQPSSSSTSDKLGLKSETLRRMMRPIEDDQLAEIAGAQRPWTNNPTTAC